ncbi:MAG: glycosyltransferase family 4 protein [Pyrinomonadaceae bacterium]|nr:glycosyltransferase family 4 protein [Pyrinomonadaceae bacterium]MBP6212773.1 glycosyltransferase family 4 protein [Pyrinomonadaceae bacterium]
MSTGKPKLIFLWNYVEWGGAQIFLLAIMKVAKPDFDIIVILPRKSMPTILHFLDQLTIKYEFLDVVQNMSAAPSLSEKLRRQWSRVHAEITSFKYLLKYDLRNSILHIETAPWQSWMLLTALAIRRANVFVTMHNFMPRASKLREFMWKMRLKWVSRLQGFHIVPSNRDTKDKLKGWVTDAFWENMEVAHTAVDPDEINAAFAAPLDVSVARLSHGIDADKFIVLCVGQFIDRKGRWVFLDAAKKVVEQTNNVTFVWLTPKLPDDVDLKRIGEYGLGDAFKAILSDSVGKKRDDVLRFFRIADVYALPSYVEGLPIALLEAMALGVPSISTRVYAIPEAVIDHETGILIEAGDSGALAAAILELQGNEALRAKLSADGRKFVLENFDERKIAAAVVQLYKRSLNRQ